MSATTWARILKSIATSQSVTIAMHRITRVGAGEWRVNGELLDFEFALYALVD